MTTTPPSDPGDVGADQLSLGRRLRQPRTILSLVLPLVLLVLVFRVALNVDVGELVTAVRAANPWLLLAAFAIFYPVSYTHLRAHETGRNLVCRLLLEKK